MNRALLAVLVLLAGPAWADQVCWLHSRLVPPITEVSLAGPNPFQYGSAQKREFPFTVPAGHELQIVTMALSTKLHRNGRASMLVLDNVFAVTGHGPAVRFDPPVVLPAGAIANARIINNDELEAQWMGAAICGHLVPAGGG